MTSVPAACDLSPMITTPSRTVQARLSLREIMWLRKSDSVIDEANSITTVRLSSSMTVRASGVVRICTPVIRLRFLMTSR